MSRPRINTILPSPLYGPRSLLLAGLLMPIMGACVDPNIESSSLPDIQYYLEYSATGNDQNRLLLYTNQSDLRLEITSPADDLTASIPLSNRVSIPNVVELQAQQEKTYELDVYIYFKDGTLYQEDRLLWRYSSEAPPDPVVGFSSPATNSDDALLYVSSSKGVETTEIWIEGDLAPSQSPQGSWRRIPDSGTFLISISEGDGLKIFRVKTRNIYGNISNEKTISILRKSVGPINCDVQVADLTSYNRYVKIRMAAQDTGPVYYRVYGDTDNSRSFQEFDSTTEATIELTALPGNKRVSVQIRDQANNFCLQQSFDFEYDPDYNPAKVQIISHQYWSDNDDVQVYLEYPSFPDKNIEVFFFGDVTGSNVGQWLPFEDTFTIRLSPTQGTRWVRVRFRENGELRAVNYDGIYLKPFLLVQGESAPYNIKLSNMNGVESLSIRGCQENYSHVSYQDIFICNPADLSIAVDYYFKDGSSLTRAVDL